MAENQTKREYFDVFGYVKTQPQKIGYAYLTPKGSIGIKAFKVLDETPLGRHLKNGLCIELKNKQKAGEYEDATIGVYINKKRENIGRVTKIEKGKIFIQAIAAMNSKKLGTFLKDGLYVQKEKTKEYQCFADELDGETIAPSAGISRHFTTSTRNRHRGVNLHP